MASVIAIDAGTTGIRALAVDETGAVADIAYRELTQFFPRPGWVEHDPAEIWDLVSETVVEVAKRLQDRGDPVVALGLTNQRETVVAWDRATGRPLHRAIVWQDRRTAQRCAELEAAGHLPLVRAHTGLVLDPYFSATKMAWLIEQGGVEISPDVVFGTVDAWVTWNLTGGAHGGVVTTDVTNASRTMLFDIVNRTWSEELCELFGVPSSVLPEVRPSCGRFGEVRGEVVKGAPSLSGVPVSGVAGDQHAALFGQACFSPGMAKATYGTGTFVLVNVGEMCPPPVEGLLTTIAWDLGEHGGGGSTASVQYALEGAVFATGAAIQWLRDGLGLIEEAPHLGPLAASVSDSAGVYFVPAFTGLGSPWWDPTARGTIVGLSSGATAANLARAVVEAMAFQVRDVTQAAGGLLGAGAGVGATAGAGAATRAVDVLRVDGGAANMDLLLQIQADQLSCVVARPTTTETTALGAATLAGLAEGMWSSVDELSEIWNVEFESHPQPDRTLPDVVYSGWRRAV
ncbi:MAG TPA: glycerol kinase GlpK, partial [Acidimicrobiales bacterium]|nr:glycerol kinase GlpK [Acidimicrobiales bacterium]